jgi:GNAT superfamily N-acetyltransferase
MKTNAQLRAGRTQDMAACAGILNEWIDETDWMPRVHSHEDVVHYYQTVVAQERRVSVVVTGAQIIGMMALGDHHLVTALYVKRAYRGQGVGQLLLNSAKRDFETDVKLWTFQKNVAAQQFYNREGFSEINRTDGDNEEGLPDILLEWRA